MTTKKITLAFLALFLLSGCNTSKRPMNEGMIDQMEETPLAMEFERQVGDKVWFAYNSSELTHKSKEHLEKQACWLAKHSHVKAQIEGHCDARGTREYNLGLGERRANAVAQYLMSHGVDGSRLDVVSYGKEKPAVMGDNEEAWSQNRRAVTVVYK